MLMFFSGLVFIFIILFFAMRADDVFITEFELNRRVERGDRRAEKLLLKKQLTPSYNFVIKASLVTFSIILVLLISEITEPLRAFFITVGLVAVASLIARSSLVFKYRKKYSDTLSLIYSQFTSDWAKKLNAELLKKINNAVIQFSILKKS